MKQTFNHLQPLVCFLCRLITCQIYNDGRIRDQNRAGESFLGGRKHLLNMRIRGKLPIIFEKQRIFFFFWGGGALCVAVVCIFYCLIFCVSHFYFFGVILDLYSLEMCNVFGFFFSFLGCLIIT